jgi:hypothetical protein
MAFLVPIYLIAFAAPPYDSISNWISQARLEGYLNYPVLCPGGNFTFCLFLWLFGRI